MREAARAFVGMRDFQSFAKSDAQDVRQDGLQDEVETRRNKSTLVLVDRLDIAEEDDLVLVGIEGSHFLWKMVRRLVGTLVKVGLGEVSVEQFADLLTGRKNPQLDIAAWTAPASGLFLEAVRY